MSRFAEHATLNNIGSFLQYYYHVTSGEPLQGFFLRVLFKNPIMFHDCEISSGDNACVYRISPRAPSTAQYPGGRGPGGRGPTPCPRPLDTRGPQPDTKVDNGRHCKNQCPAWIYSVPLNIHLLGPRGGTLRRHNMNFYVFVGLGIQFEMLVFICDVYDYRIAYA